MSWDVSKEFIDICLTANPQIRIIKFFGGEPTLNMEAIDRICSYVMEKTGTGPGDWLIGITTNGTGSAQDHLDVYQRYRIHVAISLDGPQEIHDAKRKRRGGGGSFASVINYVETLSAQSFPFALVTVYNGAHCQHGYSITDTVRWLNGYSKTVKVEAIENLSAHALEDATGLSHESVYRDSYELARNVIHTLAAFWHVEEKGVLENNVVRAAHAVVNGLAVAPKHLCSMENLYSIFPNGDIFPCYLFAANDEMRLGRIGNDIQPDLLEQRQSEFRSLLAWPSTFEHYIPWYRGIVGDVCAGDMTFPELDLRARRESSPYYAAFQEGIAHGLLEGMLSIYENHTAWIYFLAGLHQQMDLLAPQFAITSKQKGGNNG